MIKEIEIKTEYIKLDQFLKLASIASSGGDAKNIILYYDVFLNDIPVKERGKKIHSGDKVRIAIEDETHEFIVKGLSER